MRIVISGTVGVGKSTVSNLLKDELEKRKDLTDKVNFLNEETVESVYLDYYYKKPSDWAFVAQLDFLLGRFKQWLTDERERENSKKNITTIYDRHFLDDYVFAELHTIKKNISAMNSITYQTIYKELTEKMNSLDAKPDYFILLTGSFDVIIDRLKGRGREEEKSVNTEYWTDLYNNYYTRPLFQSHFSKNSKNMIKINTDNKKPEDIVKEIIALLER